jgi:hypothetical protein
MVYPVLNAIHHRVTAATRPCRSEETFTEDQA